MSNIDEGQVKKPLPKLAYWFLISGIVVLGIVLIVMGGLYLHHGVPILLGIIAILAAYGIRSWHQKRCRDYEDYLRQQLQKREKYLQEQARLYEYIRGIVKTYHQRIQKMRENLQAATRALNKAENHFHHTAYSPFWDEIEIAASELGRFSKNVAAQSSGLEDYLRRVPRYHGVPQPFPGIPKAHKGKSSKGPKGTSTALAKLRKPGNALAKRMSELVYKAQRNFEFANIYEHRKTRKTLVAGFKNLAGVLRGVGDQISNHIEELNATVEVYNEEMGALMENALAQHQARADDAWIQHELHQVETMQANLQQIELEEGTLETLDNIYNYLAEDDDM